MILRDYQNLLILLIITFDLFFVAIPMAIKFITNQGSTIHLLITYLVTNVTFKLLLQDDEYYLQYMVNYLAIMLINQIPINYHFKDYFKIVVKKYFILKQVKKVILFTIYVHEYHTHAKYFHVLFFKLGGFIYLILQKKK